MEAKLTPMGDRLLAEKVEQETKTLSGIILPDRTVNAKPRLAKVLAVGSGRLLDNGKVVGLGLKVGDIVVHSKFGGIEIEVKEEKFIVLSEKDVLAIRDGETMEMEKLKLLGDRLIVQPDAPDAATKSGIVLPKSIQKRFYTGKIVVAGPGRWRQSGIWEEMKLKKGQTVMYARYTGMDFKVSDECSLILNQRDIITVIE